MRFPLTMALLWLSLCCPVLAQWDEVIRLLSAGRARHALDTLPDVEPQASVLRLEAYLELERITDAGTLIEELSTLKVSDLPPPLDFRWQVSRGRYYTLVQQDALARRLFREALPLARGPEQEVEALDWLCWLELAADDPEAAGKAMERTQKLVPRIRDKGRLALHLQVVAALTAEQGRRAEAVAIRAAAREMFRELDMPQRVAQVGVNMASAMVGEGELEAAYQELRQALDELEKPGFREGTLLVMDNLVWVARHHTSRREELTDLFKGLLPRLPQDGTRTRATLLLTRLLLTAGRVQQVEALLKDLLEQPLRDDERCAVLQGLGRLERQAGRYQEAMALFQQALPLAKPLRTYEPYGEASLGHLWSDLGRAQADLRQFPQAIASFRQAAALEPNAYHETVARQEATSTALAAFDLETARELLTESLARAEEIPDLAIRTNVYLAMLDGFKSARTSDHDRLLPKLGALESFDALGRALLHQMVSSPEALSGYLGLIDRWAVRLRERGVQSELAYLLFWKAVFLEAAGRLPEARSVIAESIALADRSGLQTLRLDARSALARIEHAGRQPEQALLALSEAAAIAWTVSPRSGSQVSSLHGDYLREQGRYADALVAYGRALEGSDVPWRPLFGRALSLEGLQRYDQAMAELEKARGALDPDTQPRSLAAVQAAQGRLLVRLGHAAEALAKLQPSHELLLEQGDPRLSVQAAADYAEALTASGKAEEGLSISRRALDRWLAVPGQSGATLRPLFEMVVELSLRNDQPDEALRYLELSRSSELVGSVNLDLLRPDDPATAATLASLEELKGRLSALEAEAAQNDQARESVTRVLAQTRAEFFSQLDELKRRQPDFEALVQLSGSDLSAIQKHLSDDEALLEYYPAEAKLFVFAVTKQRFTLHEVNLGREDLTREVRRYADMVRDPESDLDKALQTSRKLHDLLLESPLGELGSVRRLRLLPSGPLWNVPFEALRDSAGNTLDQRYEVSFLTSADLLRTLAPPSGRPGRPLLLAPVDASDLPGAQAELKALHALLPGSRTLTGPQASSIALRELAGQSGILHFASHSRLGGSGSQAPSISLADGPLSLDQIYGLSLQPGALVVLSSCQSALGEKNPGREVTSLASAFNVAGASTVIASHWEVDDQATRELFESFYGHLLAGQSRSQALRSARREVAASHPHPYYWAAFSLFGSPL